VEPDIEVVGREPLDRAPERIDRRDGHHERPELLHDVLPRRRRHVLAVGRPLGPPPLLELGDDTVSVARETPVSSASSRRVAALSARASSSTTRSPDRER
jgi:hypothetical protein